MAQTFKADRAELSKCCNHRKIADLVAAHNESDPDGSSETLRLPLHT